MTEKRWLVVGICMHTIVSPTLRQYVAPVINNLYTFLKQTDSIDTQTYNHYLKTYPSASQQSAYKLNYEAINNNKTNWRKDVRNYNYNVQNAVDFSKLFMVTHMAHYTGFDETCDSSALLGIIVNIDKFPTIVQKVAVRVRSEVRNPWAHCNFTEWDSIRYLSSFQLMNQLIKNLKLPSADETRILGDLLKWEVNGIHFLQWTTIGLDLLEEIKKQTAVLAEYAHLIIDETDTSFAIVSTQIHSIRDEISSYCERLQILESRGECYEKEITKANKDIGLLKNETKHVQSKQEKICKEIVQTRSIVSTTTDKLDAIAGNQDLITETISNITREKNEVKEDITVIKEDIDKLKRDIKSIKYSSHIRPDEMVYFYPPDRIACFVGRESELQELELFFAEKKNEQYSHVICGLGGSGKTTIAIEFAWSFQKFYPGGIFWMSAESNEALETSILNLAFDVKTTGNITKETMFRTLKWLSSLKDKWLLIIDNTDEDEITGNVKELLLGTWKRNSCGHILITSRREPADVEESVHVSKSSCLYLETLSNFEGVTFMKKRTGKDLDDESEILLELVNELGGLPLALEQAGAFIKAKKCTFNQYLTGFKKKRLKLLNATNVQSTTTISKERLAVKTTWLLNMDYIQKQSEQEGIGSSAYKVMEIAAFLFADDIPFEIINNGCPEVDDEELNDTLQDDSLGVKQVTEILTRFSLFQRYRENSLSVHRLVQEVIRERIQNDEERRFILQCAARMINKAFNSVVSPNDILSMRKNDNSPRGSLYLWSKLAVNANSLKIHLYHFLNDHGKDISLHLNLETVNILHNTAIFHSVHQRQDEALADQVQMLHIITAINIPENHVKEYTSVKIPLLEKDRDVLQDRISTVLLPEKSIGKENDEPSSVESDKLRIQGNEYFKKKRYQDAMQYYTEGIRSCPEDNVDYRLLSNRSLLYLKVKDYENALVDANRCIQLAPSHWKGYCWKAYAIANLVKSGILPRFMEMIGLASACIAANMNEECLVEYKMKIYYPLISFRVVQATDPFDNAVADIREKPYTTLLLKRGLHILKDITPPTKSVQIIGVEDGVELDFRYCFQIMILPDAVFPFKFNREKEIHIHFENVFFVQGAQQIRVAANAIATFYKCQISNGLKGCDDFPRCTGGTGCVNSDPEICKKSAQPSVKGIVNYKTGIGGAPGICADSGGRVFIDTCILDRCGGGGVLSNGEGSKVEIRNCTIRKMRQMGIEARNGGNVIADNNVIINNQFHGISIGPRGSGTISRNYIQANGCEGIFCGGPVVEEIRFKMNTKDGSQAKIFDNIICRNGYFGISLDGGTYEVCGNKIVNNWLWGISIKSRSAAYVQMNEISENKCGGIRIGINYSASVIIDGNTIRDHTGPDIYLEGNPEHELRRMTLATDMSRIIGNDLGEEAAIYSRPTIITDRNIRRNNNKGVQHPRNAVQVTKACCFCCSAFKNMKQCAKCRLATYCSKDCQINHWSQHKHMCKILQKEYTIQIEMASVQPFMKNQCNIRFFDPSLKGIKEGPAPDPTRQSRFTVKVQSGQEQTPYDPEKLLLLYDRSVTLDITFSNPELYQLVNECGVLAGNQLSTKKIFCWASFKKNGKILCIHTDNLPPYQSW